MTTKPPIELQYGLQLLQAGRRAEAAEYLRRAAQARPLSPEIWLWLASATDDITEYRRCVDEVLRLDPTNGTALSMQAELDRIDQEAAISKSSPEFLIGEQTVARGDSPVTAEVSFDPAPRAAARLYRSVYSTLRCAAFPIATRQRPAVAVDPARSGGGDLPVRGRKFPDRGSTARPGRSCRE